jgi:hypothetical protein
MSNRRTRRSFLGLVTGHALLGGAALFAPAAPAGAFDNDTGAHADRLAQPYRPRVDADPYDTVPGVTTPRPGPGGRRCPTGHTDHDSGPTADPTNCGRGSAPHVRVRRPRRH